MPFSEWGRVDDRATVAALARELGRSRDTVNTMAVAATTELLGADIACYRAPGSPLADPTVDAAFDALVAAYV